MSLLAELSFGWSCVAVIFGMEYSIMIFRRWKLKIKKSLLLKIYLPRFHLKKASL